MSGGRSADSVMLKRLARQYSEVTAAVQKKFINIIQTKCSYHGIMMVMIIVIISDHIIQQSSEIMFDFSNN